MTEELYQEEISICKNLYKQKKGCNWGECEKCGVLPLLYKLTKGILLENLDEVIDFKKNLLN